MNKPLGLSKENEEKPRHSSRHKKPFVCIKYVGLPESLVESENLATNEGPSQGKFELAEGGTVFLDEIGDMNPYVQAKILRIMETE